MKKYRSRTHMVLLYPDNEDHKKALDKIVKSYDHAGILHYKDSWTAEDEKENSERKAGDLKKAHYHIILRFNQATWSSAICKDLGIMEHYIEPVKNFDNALQYLIHYNDDNKAQYEIDDVFGNLKNRLVESINKISKSEGEKVVELIQFIKSFEGRLSISLFARYCAENGYWAEFRRSATIFLKIIDEHNETYVKRRE